MDGFLEKCDGTLVNPDHTPNGQDILSIQQLLDAATFGTDQCGYDLDRTSSVFGSTNTSRYDGIILVVTINYQNVKPWSGRQSNISYTYKVNVLKGTKSKIARTIYVEYPFTVRKRASLACKACLKLIYCAACVVLWCCSVLFGTHMGSSLLWSNRGNLGHSI